MPAEGYGDVSAAYYGRDIRLTIKGRQFPAGRKPTTTLLTPADALRLMQELAASLEAVISPVGADRRYEPSKAAAASDLATSSP